ncbi:TPA: HNH endonuclease [Pseudomonas putida]|nr:HNH endonuclease [Pseudomonas putida]
MLTQEQLFENLHYNPETGVFTRLVTTSNRSVAGSIAGGYGANGYFRVSLLGKRYFAHRLAWFYMTGEWPDEIDHVNCIRDDNRFCNLRVASRKQNSTNMLLKPSNTSGFKNVSFDKAKGKWIARVRLNGKRKNLGLFETPEDAYQAWQRCAEPHDREFFNPG